MPFNSTSYHRNKNRRQAFAYLDKARANPERRSEYAHLARLYWRSYLGYRSVGRCSADLAAMRRGEITAADFLKRWKPD